MIDESAGITQEEGHAAVLSRSQAMTAASLEPGLWFIGNYAATIQGKTTTGYNPLFSVMEHSKPVSVIIPESLLALRAAGVLGLY